MVRFYIFSIVLSVFATVMTAAREIPESFLYLNGTYKYNDNSGEYNYHEPNVISDLGNDRNQLPVQNKFIEYAKPNILTERPRLISGKSYLPIKQDTIDYGQYSTIKDYPIEINSFMLLPYGDVDISNSRIDTYSKKFMGNDGLMHTYTMKNDVLYTAVGREKNQIDSPNTKSELIDYDVLLSMLG